MTQKNVLVVIPLRLKSQRIPEKVLKKLGPHCLGAHTVKKVQKAIKGKDGVSLLVAVDDIKTKLQIEKEVKGLTLYITDPKLPSGTDRVFAATQEYLKNNPQFKASLGGIINVQGDMPFLGSEGIKQIVDFYQKASDQTLQKYPISTLAQEWPEDSKFDDLGAVKVITTKDSRALYFSRYPIPYSRITRKKALNKNIAKLHIGVYGYSLEALTRFCSHSATPLELCEGLEQLRAMWLGMDILVLNTQPRPSESFRGIDTPPDFVWAKRFLVKKGKK